MAANSFGTLFRITTWGESHGKGIGVVVDGCPAGLSLSEDDINKELIFRRPGNSTYTTPRNEKDQAQIFSGVFQGKTTGAPISIVIFNKDIDSSKYEPIKNLLRPGHANYTYLEKYGYFDYRGGGRASARETACRVAAGAIAKKLLAHYHIDVAAYITSIGNIVAKNVSMDIRALVSARNRSKVYCPDIHAAEKMMQQIHTAKANGNSLGGIITFISSYLPIGLGDPVYEKLEANLAKAMLSIPASKGFMIGEGFGASQMMGSEHNDLFYSENGKIKLHSNHAGGTLGGITTGKPLVGSVAFKPTSSINKVQSSVDISGNIAKFKLPHGSRHDPCVAIRAVPVVEAMIALVLADAILHNRSAKLE